MILKTDLRCRTKGTNEFNPNEGPPGGFSSFGSYTNLGSCETMEHRLCGGSPLTIESRFITRRAFQQMKGVKIICRKTK